MLPYNKETKFVSCNQQASPSAGKYTRVVLVPCRAFKCFAIYISRYFWSPSVSFVKTDDFWVRVTKSYLQDWSFVNSQLTFLFWTYIKFNELWPYYQNDGNQTVLNNINLKKLSFTNIWGLRLSFVEFESFLESNYPDILALLETYFNDSIDFGNFSVRGYLLLIQIYYVTHMHGLTIYVSSSRLHTSSYIFPTLH